MFLLLFTGTKDISIHGGVATKKKVKELECRRQRSPRTERFGIGAQKKKKQDLATHALPAGHPKLDARTTGTISALGLGGELEALTGSTSLDKLDKP